MDVRQQISRCNIGRDSVGLKDLYDGLVVQKMRLDKEISIFLSDQHYYDMDPDEGNPELWKKYRQLCNERDKVDANLKICTFYLGRI
jgi:hypothetical protein